MDQALHVIDPSAASSLPTTVSPGLAAAATAGQIVIVPGDPASARTWWTVDPASGETRSIVDPGFGGQVAEGTTALASHAGVEQNPYTNATANNLPRIAARTFGLPKNNAELQQLYRQAVAQVE